MKLTRSSVLHLRIPFSVFLLPVFLFAFALSNSAGVINVLLVFFILHFLLYPASNGYNSYFDKDEGSIGGLRNPPKVRSDLYTLSLTLDTVALFLAFFINLEFVALILLYGMASKAYSHPSIRLKKYPIISWVIAGFFQGFVTLLAAYIGINGYGFEVLSDTRLVLAGLLSSFLLWGSYPMTQVYQHEEDANRGDVTLSLKLGVLGTFHFTMLLFFVAVVGFVIYFESFNSPTMAYSFVAFTMPMVIYFFRWYLQVRKDTSRADFDHTMKLNLISSTALSLFFIYLKISEF